MSSLILILLSLARTFIRTDARQYKNVNPYTPAELANAPHVQVTDVARILGQHSRCLLLLKPSPVRTQLDLIRMVFNLLRANFRLCAYRILQKLFLQYKI